MHWVKKKRALMAEVATTQQEAEERLSQYEAALAKSQKIQKAFDATVDDLPQNPISVTLDNIEQQIIFAILHLNLGGDIKAALNALQKAQSLVQEIEDKHLSALENSLTKNIETLKTASSIDTKAIIYSVVDLAAKIDTLPLASETGLKRVDIDFMSGKMLSGDSAWSKFFDEIWQDTKSFIHVKKVKDPEIQLLSPSQAYFLRENLKLKFLLMRFSLLSGDINSFNTDHQAAISWINQYYNKESASVTNFLLALARLQADGSGFNLPDVSTSLDEIHYYRIKRSEENK